MLFCGQGILEAAQMRRCCGVVFMAAAMAFGCGDSKQIESDYVGPRKTEFKSGISFAVCIITKSAGPLTVERVSPFARDESLLLLQPPILTSRDVSAVTIEEAPAQWTSLTVQLHQNAAEQFAAARKDEGAVFAVLIDDKIVAIQKPSEIEDTSFVTVSESSAVPDIRSAVE